MDRAKRTYLLVAVNVAIGIFVVIFLIMKLTGTNEETPEGPANVSRVPGSVEDIRNADAGATGPEARGTPLTEQAPNQPSEVEVRRPPSLPPDTVYIPQPAELPEGTLEKVRQTRWLMKNLQLAAELYRSRHDVYPPSTIDEDNDVNAGIEALYAYLDVEGLLEDRAKDEWIGNTDGDAFPEDFRLQGREPVHVERMEILDAWGNPLIYFRHDRYRNPATYRIDGEDQTATPQISTVTDEFHGRDYIEIWSAGPNGENENGGGDDVTSWHIRE